VAESTETPGVLQAPLRQTAGQTPPRRSSPLLPAPPAVGWRIALGVVWLLAILLVYYAVHKPLNSADLDALRTPVPGASWSFMAAVPRVLGELADLLTALWVLLLAGAVGHTLWRTLRLPEPGRAEARLGGTVLGLGALGLAAFALGLLGLLMRPAAFVVLGAPTLALARPLMAQARWWLRAARLWWRAGWLGGPVDRAAALFSVATLTLVTVAALLPPTAWDALAYHLASARADITTGHITLDPSTPQFYQPQVVEMLYALLLLVRDGDGAAALLHAGCGLLAVALVTLLGWRTYGGRGAVRSAALALAIPVVAELAQWPYVDLALAAAELGALAMLTRWNAARLAGDHLTSRGWLLAAALASGVALDIKYTGAYALAALAALIALAAWHETRANPGAARRARPWDAARLLLGRLWAALQPAVGFAAIGLLVGSVWLVRNLLVTGDPVFPYHLGTLFPLGPDWDAQRTAFINGPGWGTSALWRVPLLPLEATLLGRSGTLEFDATLGPLLVLLLPLGLLTLRSGLAPHDAVARARAPAGERSITPPLATASARTTWYWLLGFAALQGLWWGIELTRTEIAMQSRLFLSVFLALVVPAAAAWIRLDAVRVPKVSLGRLVGVAAVLCFALTLLGQAGQALQADNLAVLLGAQTRAGYLNRELGPYMAAMHRLDALGPHARVDFLWEPRFYLTHARVAPDSFIDNFNVLYRRCHDANGITRCLRARGFTHVLLYQQGLHFVRSAADRQDSAAELATLDTLLATWRPIYRDDTPLMGQGPSGSGWYVLYALDGAP
jgi:hypothetical protein